MRIVVFVLCVAASFAYAQQPPAAPPVAPGAEAVSSDPAVAKANRAVDLALEEKYAATARLPTGLISKDTIPPPRRAH